MTAFILLEDGDALLTEEPGHLLLEGDLSIIPPPVGSPGSGLRIATTSFDIPEGGTALAVVEFDDPGDAVWLVINGVMTAPRIVELQQVTITIEELVNATGTVTVEAWTSTNPRQGGLGIAIPPGGTPGQVLTKVTTTDFDADWETDVDPDTISIADLPDAGPLTGAELVPIVQGGVTDKTTTQDIANLGGGGGELWEVVSGANDLLQPTPGGFDYIWLGDINTGNGGIQGAQTAGTGAGDVHETYLTVAPGIGAGGGDIQAESFVVGKDAVIDWFYWSRRRGTGYDAGSYWDAVGSDEAGLTPEAFFEVYADGTDAFVEHYVNTDNPSGNEAAYDLHADVAADVAFHHFYGKNAFFKFARTGGSLPSMDVAPDAQLDIGEWSMGYDGTDIIFKVNDSGTIKTAVLTPT